MKAWLFPALVGCVLSLSGPAVAQQSGSRSEGPFDSVIPAYFSNGSGRVDLAADASERVSVENPLPDPLSAAPPPEPESPSWGEYLAPPVSPVAKPPIEYDIIGPPTGFMQRSGTQDYRAVISDPDALLGHDAQIGQTVNIFRPDGMAPVGVFGDHTLPVGSTFISYRYLQNSFDQNYDGTHRIGVPTSYALAPTRMLQDSQVALVEYGATKDFTIVAYLPFQHNEINFQTATGSSFQAFTNPGDIRVTGLYVLSRGEGSQSHVNLGLNVPVGFLERAGGVAGFLTPPQAIPYSLRTSSGTYDLLLGYTYRKQFADWTLGAQANGVIPTGMNTLGYELGNQFQLTSWASRRLTDRWSTSARLDGHVIQNIHGADNRLSTTLTPVNQTNTQAGQYINALLGVNYLLTRPGHRFREQRLFLESGLPVYQWYDGPQLGLSWTLNAGWGMTF